MIVFHLGIYLAFGYWLYVNHGIAPTLIGLVLMIIIERNGYLLQRMITEIAILKMEMSATERELTGILSILYSEPNDKDQQ